MIRGSITAADWERLRDYTRTVSKFIVTDDNSKAQISPAAFIRLARLLNPDAPLLPCLSDLVIVDADASIAYLDLLLTPSLKSLKASCIPDAHQWTFSSFLTAIEHEAPLLQTLILGPGRFLQSSLQKVFQFNSLRHLELKHEDSKLPFAFFDKIGALTMLETFILDARHVSGTVMSDEPIILPAVDPSPSPSDSLPNSSAMGGNRDEHGAAGTDVHHSNTFNQLTTLQVTGQLPLLEDLIHRVTSNKLEDISITFIRLSFDELKVSLAEEAEAAEQERIAEDRRRKEAEKQAREQFLEDEIERLKIIEEEAKKRKAEEDRRREEMEGEKKEDMSTYSGGKKKKKHGKREEMKQKEERERERLLEEAADYWRRREEVEMKMKMEEEEEAQRWLEEEAEKERRKLWKEEMNTKHIDDWGCGKQKRDEEQFLGGADSPSPPSSQQLARLSFDDHTVSFTEILRKICIRWTTSLKSLSICQLGGSFQCLIKPPTFPEDLFRKMLLLPAIESLEVEGWIMDFVEDVLNAAEPIPNLKSLLLPPDETNFGISLRTLRHVAKTCPKLESFQCFIDPLFPVPEYSIPTNAGLSHGLRILSVGAFPGPLPLDNLKQAGYLIARHCYLLFPQLETIKASEEHNAELWATVDEFVKIFQTARMDDLNRQ